VEQPIKGRTQVKYGRIAPAYASSNARRKAKPSTRSGSGSSTKSYSNLRVHLHFDEGGVAGIDAEKDALVRQLAADAVGYWQVMLFLLRGIYECSTQLPLKT
jgi:hypothetical protein